MAQELPKFDANKTYWVKGKTLNAIIEAIRANRPLAGSGIMIAEAHDGRRISTDGNGGDGDSELRELDVSHGGAPAKRMVDCGRAYIYVDDEIEYLE